MSARIREFMLLAILIGGCGTAAGADCAPSTDANAAASIATLDAAKLGFPQDTIIVRASATPAIENTTAFDRDYLAAIARAAKTAGRDPAAIAVPTLPYASFSPDIYAEASRRHPAPAVAFADAAGRESLLITLSPGRLLALAAGAAPGCGAPLVLDANMLNSLAEKWARDVLPRANSSAIRDFADELPQHLSFMPALLNTAGSGGPLPFTELFVSHTERCLHDSLPYFESVLGTALSTNDPAKALSDLMRAPPIGLAAMRPACLSN